MVWQYQTGAYYMHSFDCYWILVINNKQIGVWKLVKLGKDIFDNEHIEIAGKSTRIFISEKKAIRNFRKNSTTENFVGQWQRPTVFSDKCGDIKCIFLINL